MAVTLYGNYIDYNGDRTFIAISNCGYVSDCGGYQCTDVNCVYLSDGGETIGLSGTNRSRYNCACNC